METKIIVVLVIKIFSKVSVDQSRFYFSFRHRKRKIYVGIPNISGKFRYTMTDWWMYSIIADIFRFQYIIQKQQRQCQKRHSTPLPHFPTLHYICLFFRYFLLRSKKTIFNWWNFAKCNFKWWQFLYNFRRRFD